MNDHYEKVAHLNVFVDVKESTVILNKDDDTLDKDTLDKDILDKDTLDNDSLSDKDSPEKDNRIDRSFKKIKEYTENEGLSWFRDYNKSKVEFINLFL